MTSPPSGGDSAVSGGLGVAVGDGLELGVGAVADGSMGSGLGVFWCGSGMMGSATGVWPLMKCPSLAVPVNVAQPSLLSSVAPMPQDIWWLPADQLAGDTVL
jgi:hypothetical protein